MTRRFKRASVTGGYPACYIHLDIIHRASGRKLENVIEADAVRGVVTRYREDRHHDTECLDCKVDIVAGPSYPANILDVNLFDDVVAGVIFDEDLTQDDRDGLAKHTLEQFDAMPDLAQDEPTETSGMDEASPEVGRMTFQGRNHDNDVIQPIHFEITGVATAMKEMDRVRREIAEATLVMSPRFEVRPGQGGFVIKTSTGRAGRFGMSELTRL